MNNFENLLSGGDLRTIGSSNVVAKLVNNQKNFDQLFALLFHENRLVVMRAADAIEKITIIAPQYLDKHKVEIFSLSKTVKNKELKWHLALLLSRMKMSEDEFNSAWEILMRWTKDKNNSKIVRVNSMQALSFLSRQNEQLSEDFQQLMNRLEKEKVPSITARIKKLKKEII